MHNSTGSAVSDVLVAGQALVSRTGSKINLDELCRKAQRPSFSWPSSGSRQTGACMQSEANVDLPEIEKFDA